MAIAVIESENSGVGAVVIKDWRSEVSRLPGRKEHHESDAQLMGALVAGLITDWPWSVTIVSVTSAGTSTTSAEFKR